MGRAIRLSKERETELLRWIEDLYTQTKSDWALWVQDLWFCDKAYHGYRDPKTWPWKGSSNVAVPITPIATERTHSALLGVVDQPDELLSILPTEASDVRRVEPVQLFANWAWFTEMNMPQYLDVYFHNTCVYGMQRGILLWRRQQRRIRETFPVQKSEILRADPVRVAQFHFQSDAIKIEKVDSRVARVDYMDQGVRRKAQVEILLDEDRVDPREDEYEYEVTRTSIRKDCPELDVPSPEDLLSTPDGLMPDDGQVDFYSMWSEIEDLQERRRTGYYKIGDELWEKCVNDYMKFSTADSSQLDSLRRTLLEANSPVKSVSARRRGRFHVQKVFMPWDADGDGSLEQIVATILWDAGGKPHLIRADWLESIAPHGERPIVTAPFIYRNTIPYAMGVPQFLRGVQAEVDTLHNQIVDANTIRNLPFYLYRAGSSLAPTPHGIRPGEGIPTDDPASVRFPQWGSSSVSDVQTLGMLMELAERMVPHGDVSMGRGSGGNRTMGGVALLVQQGQEVWSKFIKRAGKAMESLGRHTLAYYGAWMPPEKEFRVAGKNELVKITREDLRQGWDFRVRASALASNKEIQRQYAMMRWSLFSQHPMFQSPERLYYLAKGVLKSQEVVDWQAVLGPEPDEMRWPHLIPDQEHVLFSQGISHEPHPDENHEQHIQEHQQWLAMLPNFGGAVKKMVLDHIELHKNLLGQAQRRQMQAAEGIPAGPSRGVDFGTIGGQVPIADSMQQDQGGVLSGLAQMIQAGRNGG